METFPCWADPTDMKLEKFCAMIEERLEIPICLISVDTLPKQEWIADFLQETS